MSRPFLIGVGVDGSSRSRDAVVLASRLAAPTGASLMLIAVRAEPLVPVPLPGLRSHLECPLVVAPLGARDRGTAGLASVGVGFDGSPESHAALDVGTSLAAVAGASLTVRGVVADRLPARLPVPHIAGREAPAAPEKRVESLAAQAETAIRDAGARADIDIAAGRPSDELLELGEKVDLLVLGSSAHGRRGTVAPGKTADALLHHASCAVAVVPRPFLTEAADCEQAGP